MDRRCKHGWLTRDAENDYLQLNSEPDCMDTLSGHGKAGGAGAESAREPDKIPWRVCAEQQRARRRGEIEARPM